MVAAPDPQGLGGARGAGGALPKGPECQAEKPRPLPAGAGDPGAVLEHGPGPEPRTKVEETQSEPRAALPWPPPRPLRPLAWGSGDEVEAAPSGLLRT